MCCPWVNLGSATTPPQPQGGGAFSSWKLMLLGGCVLWGQLAPSLWWSVFPEAETVVDIFI